MTLMLFSNSLIKSSGDMMRISRSSALSNVMAMIYADYRPYMIWQPSTNYAVGNKVLPVGMNGRFYYICPPTLCAGGISGPLEPSWNDSGTTSDGSVVIWTAGAWQASTPYNQGDIVFPTNPNGHFYRCVNPGQSGSTEPPPPPGTSGIWPTNNEDCSSFISDGPQVQWMELLMYLYCQIGTPDPVNMKTTKYGQYYVVANRFVTFDSNNTIQPISAGGSQNVLEVKIQSVGTNGPGEQVLTTLFIAKEN